MKETSIKDVNVEYDTNSTVDKIMDVHTPSKNDDGTIQSNETERDVEDMNTSNESNEKTEVINQ